MNCKTMSAITHVSSGLISAIYIILIEFGFKKIEGDLLPTSQWYLVPVLVRSRLVLGRILICS
jgi:hypothetical protein